MNWSVSSLDGTVSLEVTLDGDGRLAPGARAAWRSWRPRASAASAPTPRSTPPRARAAAYDDGSRSVADGPPAGEWRLIADGADRDAFDVRQVPADHTALRLDLAPRGGFLARSARAGG